MSRADPLISITCQKAYPWRRLALPVSAAIKLTMSLCLEMGPYEISPSMLVCQLSCPFACLVWVTVLLDPMCAASCHVEDIVKQQAFLFSDS